MKDPRPRQGHEGYIKHKYKKANKPTKATKRARRAQIALEASKAAQKKVSEVWPDQQVPSEDRPAQQVPAEARSDQPIHLSMGLDDDAQIYDITTPDRRKVQRFLDKQSRIDPLAHVEFILGPGTSPGSTPYISHAGSSGFG